jgi:hypothetical protein
MTQSGHFGQQVITQARFVKRPAMTATPTAPPFDHFNFGWVKT